MKYRKRPVVIDAEQLNGETGQANRLGLEWREQRGSMPGPGWYVLTLEGAMRADVGDWIITGVEGEKYPCKDSIFRKTYVEDAIPTADTKPDAIPSSDTKADPISAAMLENGQVYWETRAMALGKSDAAVACMNIAAAYHVAQRICAIAAMGKP